MYCSRCGFQNDPGAVFCSKCGAALEAAGPSAGQTPPEGYAPRQESAPQPGYYAPPQESAPQPGYYAPPQESAPQPGYYAPPQEGAPQPGYYAPPPPKKKHTGLIIGLVAGGVALIGALLAVYLLFLSGPNLNGLWICEDRGWALELKSGELTEYSLAGTDMTKYTYENGAGKAALQNGDVSFTVKGDKMSLADEQSGDKYLFTRGDAKTDIDAVVLKGLAGMWSSEEMGEVIELDDGTINVHSGTGEYTGSYDYDVDKGQGTISLKEDTYTFAAGWDTLDVDTIGTYTRADSKLDVQAFLSEYANPLLNTWYDPTGTYGQITFKADNTYELVMYGQTMTGTYTYDTASGTGTITAQDGSSSTLSYADGTLLLDGVEFTLDYVEQPEAGDMYTAIEGTWYDTTLPDESVVFNNDGTVEIISTDLYYTGTFTFDPLELSGVITVTEGEQSQDYNFYLQDGTLYLDQYTYTRQETAAQTDTILGTWYDAAGQIGTLYFDKDGLAMMDSQGTVYSGTYTFDESAGIGAMTLDYVDGQYTWNLSLWAGSLYTDDATYTKDYVAQSVG